jgi:hypothetical protein
MVHYIYTRHIQYTMHATRASLIYIKIQDLVSFEQWCTPRQALTIVSAICERRELPMQWKRPLRISTVLFSARQLLRFQLTRMKSWLSKGCYFMQLFRQAIIYND